MFIGPILGGLIAYYASFDLLMLIFGGTFFLCGVVELIENIRARISRLNPKREESE